ncbi:MAG: hypothetical protein J6B95_01835 [Oscillospiraceae bacterium]|nr:hypothetical protein [Oscillospiraceae bacterium]
MFQNIGGKIKVLAQVVCWIGISISIIAGIALISEGGFIFGLVMAAAGSLASWVGSFLTYGLGQLIENTDILVALSKKAALRAQAADDTQQDGPDETTSCPHCGKPIIVPAGTLFAYCPWCNKSIDP